MQAHAALALCVLHRQVEEPVEVRAGDLVLAGLDPLEDQPRGEMAQVHGDALVHPPHALVADLPRMPAHEAPEHVARPVPAGGIEREAVVDGVDPGQHALAEVALHPAPVPLHAHRLSETDVHVRMLEQEVALDQQFLGKPPGQPAAREHVRAPAQQVVSDAHRPEGDVRGHDAGGLARCGEQRRGVRQPEVPGPGFDLARAPGVGRRAHRLLERIEGEPQHRRAGVVPAPLPGGARVHAEVALLVEHPPVLDHAALGEDHDLASAQDLAREEGEQARMVVGDGAHADEVVGEGVAFDEEVGPGHGAAVRAGLDVDEVLGDEGLEAREVVEEEDVALGELVAGLVQLQVDPEEAAQHREQPGRPSVRRGVDLEIHRRSTSRAVNGSGDDK